VVETRGYNSDNTLSTISFGGSGTAIGNLTYTWDSNKNKTSETIGGVMSPYSFTQAGTTYDAEDRLTGFARAATSGTPQLSQSWNLSAVGDWNSVTTNGTAQSCTHGPTHELVTAGGQSVTHDTKGNMLLIPASVRANSSPLVLTWDFDNRMVSADVGADSVIDVAHQYDALGRRVARTASGSTTVFVQVDQQTICDYASGATPASSTYRYLYGSYIDEPIVRIATINSETTWYHRNQQYSIVACTDSSGAATERYAYTAYGLPTITDGSGTVRTSSAIANRYTYTGREWDGVLGLYHYRARMYEATVGRFCSRDPIGYKGSDWNLYEVFQCSPLFRLDPDGLKWRLVFAGKATCRVVSRETPNGNPRINGTMCNYHCTCPAGTRPDIGSQSHFTRPCKEIAPLPPSCMEWKWDPEVPEPERIPVPHAPPEPLLCEIKVEPETVVVCAGGVGCAYICYRVIRMIPSIFCPPTAIPNLVIP
jgi:RHS repeat-associated protein